MSYKRDRLSNGRVAHTRYAGDEMESEELSDGVLFSVKVPVADVLDTPNGKLQRQLLHGDSVLVIDQKDGFAFGEAQDGNYVGYIAQSDLGVFQEVSHVVSTFGAHVYPTADIKTVPHCYLPFAAGVYGANDGGDFVEVNPGGFVPLQQLSKERVIEKDAIVTALRFMGVPYLWGGDSNLGLDCSGLVHIAMRAAGRQCPRDSDQQKRFFPAIDRTVGLQRGDLVFWKGHVAMMVDADKIVHANGHHMAVTLEDLNEVAMRIKDTEGKGITGFARP